jgi:hypothetical protein
MLRKLFIISPSKYLYFSAATFLWCITCSQTSGALTQVFVELGHIKKNLWVAIWNLRRKIIGNGTLTYPSFLGCNHLIMMSTLAPITTYL